jgi:hypothetical protein
MIDQLVEYIQKKDIIMDEDITVKKQIIMDLMHDERTTLGTL